MRNDTLGNIEEILHREREHLTIRSTIYRVNIYDWSVFEEMRI